METARRKTRGGTVDEELYECFMTRLIFTDARVSLLFAILISR